MVRNGHQEGSVWDLVQLRGEEFAEKLLGGSDRSIIDMGRLQAICMATIVCSLRKSLAFNGL